MAGVDRFYVGHMGVGVGKLLTFGGLGVWWVVDLFLIRNVAAARNDEIARTLKEAIAESS